MDLLILQVSPVSYFFLLLRVRYLLATLFSGTLSLFSNLRVRDQVTISYKGTVTITFFTNIWTE